MTATEAAAHTYGTAVPDLRELATSLQLLRSFVHRKYRADYRWLNAAATSVRPPVTVDPVCVEKCVLLLEL